MAVTEPAPINRIYFDTNVLWHSRWPRPSAAVREVAEIAHKTGVSLFVPETVCTELHARWDRDFAQQMKEAEDALETLSGMILGPTRDLIPNLNSLKLSSGMYESGFRATKEELRLQVVGFEPERGGPNVDELVYMAARRIAPFGEKDRGFRDAVILFNVIEHLRNVGGRGALVTADDALLAKADIDSHVANGGVTLERCVGLRALATRLAAALEHVEYQELQALRSRVIALANAHAAEQSELIAELLENHHVLIPRPIVVQSVERPVGVTFTDALVPLPSTMRSRETFGATVIGTVEVTITYKIFWVSHMADRENAPIETARFKTTVEREALVHLDTTPPTLSWLSSPRFTDFRNM